MEVLMNTKRFLTDQVKKSEEAIKTLQKEKDVINELAKIEKQTK
jgi:hypothetical protein